MKNILNKINSIFEGKYLKLFKNLLIQGITPQKLAFSIAGASLLGIFPVLGSTTLLCTMFALLFRLNLPVVQLINFTVYPLQILLIIPLMKMGEILFGFEKLQYNFNEILTLIENDVLNAINILWTITVQAIGAWFIVALFFSLIIYSLIYKLLKNIMPNAVKN